MALYKIAPSVYTYAVRSEAEAQTIEKESAMLWKIRCWIVSLRPETLFVLLATLFTLLANAIVEVQLWIAHQFERLHFATRQQEGKASLELVILLACFVVAAILIVVSPVGQALQLADFWK